MRSWGGPCQARLDGNSNVKSIEEGDAQDRFAQILDEAQREPVVIRRQSCEIANVLSVDEYERLCDGAVRGFLELRENIAREAAGAGLTAERLSELLDSD